MVVNLESKENSGANHRKNNQYSNGTPNPFDGLFSALMKQKTHNGRILPYV